MSWTFNSAEAFDKKDILAKVHPRPQDHPVGVADACQDQILTARNAAALLAHAIGLDDQVTISMSGHANPDHRPCEGWSDEFITVTVSQKRRPG